MDSTIFTCPQCGAPLPATRFATFVVCSFCANKVRIDPSAVSARKYREAFEAWNAPPSNAAQVFAIAGAHWVAERLVARGETSDVYRARSTRWPSETVLLKVVRDSGNLTLLENEWTILQHLHIHAAAHNIALGARVPAPRVKEDRAFAYRWESGFVHTFEAVRDAHRGGIPPVASIWVWRRILEVLGIMRRAGLAHGAILPNHLLIENGEHGVRLVGFNCANSVGSPLRVILTELESFYPASLLKSRKLTHAADLAMSARCVAYLLGDRDVPSELANLLQRVGADDPDADPDPWKLHAELGRLAEALFGPPAFHPITMT